MKFPDLQSFLEEVEKRGELVRISQELSPRYEVACAIREAAKKRGAVVLCEKVKGYDVPVAGNVLGSLSRLAMSLNVKEEKITTAYLAGRDKPVKPRIVSRGPVQEVVLKKNIDIGKLMPVLTHHQKDAGPYMTCAFIVARDPDSGIRGMGIHRIQVKGKDTVGIFLATPPLSHFLARAEQQGKPLEIAIVSGADPVTYFASPQAAPQGIDKYDIAGGLARTPVELVKCHSVDLEVPAQAQFVLEGQIIPGKREKEGPFGESTGYYLTYDNPVATINTITHRRNPIYHALTPFGQEENVLLFASFQIDTVRQLQSLFPSVKDVRSPKFGVVYVQVEKKDEREVSRIIEHLFTQAGHNFAKIVIVVDEDVDISDPGDIAWALGSRVRPDRDVIIKHDFPGLSIDPSAYGGKRVGKLAEFQTRTSKMGIDATKPLDELDRFEKIDVPESVKKKVARMLAAQSRK